MTNQTVFFLGKKISYSLSGNGPAIVLLHGFLEDSSIWNDYVSVLENQYQVICMDLPGHGNSESLNEKQTIAAISDALYFVLKKEACKRVCVFGHSMGGYVALAFADRYPDLCVGFGLINSTAFADSDVKKRDRDRAIKVINKNPKIFIQEAIPNLFAHDKQERFKQEIECLKEKALAISKEDIIHSIIGVKNRSDYSEFFSKTKLPVLFIAGKNDTITVIEKSLEQLESNRQVVGIVFEDCGHMAFIEKKEETLRALQEFLKKNCFN